MKIPLFVTYSDEKESQYAKKVLDRGINWANGPEIQEFEQKIGNDIGKKHCIVFNSGTSALHAILSAFNIRKQEVIVPSFTFIATANSVLLAGSRPVFADIEDQTFGLDPESIKEKITSKTKAIIPVHYGGCACKIREIKEIAQDHDLILIEDAAEAMGGKIDSMNIGSFGDAAMFSFAPNKIISTGEGGCLVTDSTEIYEKLKLTRSHGRLETSDYFTSIEYMDYISLGYNFRMPTICAAVGLAQFEKINYVINKRRSIAQHYNEKLSKIDEITCPISQKNRYHVYQLYSILINEGKKKRNELQKYLSENGIYSKVYFDPVHKTHFYEKELKYSIKLEKTEEISEKILTIPIYPSLSNEEIEYITNKIKIFFEKN